MYYKGFISFAAVWVFIIISVSSGPGCANIIPPAGGPRDSLPPVLVKANPGDSTRNFTGNKIVFTFNEFIETQNVQENLVISPLPGISPSVDYRLNTLTVKLKDTLESNTTYSLNFGNSIKDFTEGNVLKGFRYTFSTGNYIDSLELRGNVLLAETGKADTSLIVMLHSRADDSAVVKDRPRYIAKLDGKGNFVFRNLPPKTFYLYALKDDGGTHRYFSDKQLFAFAAKPVTPGAKNEPITLYAYSAKPPSPVTTVPKASPGNRIKPATTADKRLKFLNNLINNQQDLLSDLTLTFEQPLRYFDSTKAGLYTDSTFTKAAAYKWEQDSSKKTVRLHLEWKENTVYHVILDKDFAEDSTGKRLLKTDTLNFKTKKLVDYGSLKIRLKNLDLTRNPVLLIVAGEIIIKSIPMTGNEFSQSLFLPGEYELRILYDENKNGKWDPGEFFGKHRQPEIVKPIDRKIPVKANFQNEFEFAL